MSVESGTSDLRDKFAGDALRALAPQALSIKHVNSTQVEVTMRDPDAIAIMCYKLADAMLKERSK